MYRKGLRDGIPIALGYVSVAFAFGIQASAAGLYPWQALLISLLNVTSAGQVAGLQLMVAGAGMAEMALTQLTINLRYALMSLALSQKLDGSMTLLHRLTISFCNTDEVFLVASAQPGRLGKRYLYGLTNGPYAGWALGTFLGAAAGDLLPASVTSALGLAIYGMFLAIVLPPFRKDRAIRLVVLIAVAMSCAFVWLPWFAGLTGGFRIILCAVAAAAVGAWLAPVPETPCEPAGAETLPENVCVCEPCAQGEEPRLCALPVQAACPGGEPPAVVASPRPKTENPGLATEATGQRMAAAAGESRRAAAKEAGD